MSDLTPQLFSDTWAPHNCLSSRISANESQCFPHIHFIGPLPDVEVHLVKHFSMFVTTGHFNLALPLLCADICTCTAEKLRERDVLWYYISPVNKLIMMYPLLLLQGYLCHCFQRACKCTWLLPCHLVPDWFR